MNARVSLSGLASGIRLQHWRRSEIAALIFLFVEDVNGALVADERSTLFILFPVPESVQFEPANSAKFQQLAAEAAAAAYNCKSLDPID